MRIKKFNESGEWSNDVDLDFVLENPDNDSEEANWIKSLYNDLLEVKKLVENNNLSKKVNFSINNIKGFDMYQGPFANVTIGGDNYTIWTSVDEYYTKFLWIEGFKMNNMDSDQMPGFKGTIKQLSEAILEEYAPINREIKKFNL